MERESVVLLDLGGVDNARTEESGAKRVGGGRGDGGVKTRLGPCHRCRGEIAADQGWHHGLSAYGCECFVVFFMLPHVL